ncbi:AAA family ATPase [Rhizobium calliandrae]|uniref:histidine kinase n=1 Tax=Rhizobium calliandrae TaxID=1312182 RepID=A0ABT7KE08_9HYPH|nr:AAA family ATPase [Rhizobium calliandrae]MDL2406855.1 AAA family ATPase [Rhizobium calliandrae]
MVPHSQNVAEDGSHLAWEDGERAFRRGWRLDDVGKRRAVLLVAPTADHPSRSSLERLTREYELRDELDGAWVARPLDLVRDAGRTLLVLEDAGGEPLDRLLGAPMETALFLRVATAVAAALGGVHQHGLVHKDIKPANILFNEATGEVRLTGFGIALRFARERQSPHPPETIAGTLAYMAPEQTGRMNRSIDTRSDLYALGVTFYQMITGVLPFTAAEPMEWVHCHLAKQPVPPAERLKEIPGVTSAIVMKLLAKRAEDRYQTAAGLESDLRNCLIEWEAQGRIEDFPLGEHDTPDRLLIPEKLYGRECEVETLLAAFDRVVNGGAPELVLVAGYSGVGKSSVVNELQAVLVLPRGLFASGKFDQLKRDVPYATLAQALRSLIRPLLSKSDGELAPWRDVFQQTLGSNAGLMADLVPELRLLIGELPPIVELPPQDAQIRFQMVLRQLIGVFARPEHPLVLFIDDLQWLDAATLDLLADLLARSDLRNLLLIGAFRDNEVTAAHPLMRKLETMRATGRVQDIKLAPLTTNDLGNLIAESLRCDVELAEPLATLVHAKTDGNPFFVTQFLHVLADESLLVFDHGRARWSWDLGAIDAKRYTDNVVELMAGKLTRLPLDTLDALRQLACLGNVADVAMLSIVLEISEDQVHVALADALRQQFIERLEHSYRFVHDRMQEAAYALIPEQSRAELHLTIGRMLLARTPREKRDEVIFEIVNQLNRGAPLITSQEECEQLAELNQAAGKRAKASAAYTSALTYLVTGAALLPEDAWESRQELAFELELDRAECEFLTGAQPEAEQRLKALSDRAATTVERASVTCLLADLYTTLGQSSQAVAVGLDYLRHLGIEWSRHPSEEEARCEYERVWSQLGGRAIEDLVDFRLMSDAASRATLEVLTRIIPPAFFTDANLYALIASRAVNLSLERGNCESSCFAYATLGVVAGAQFQDYQAAFRFGRLGCDLVEQRGLRRFEARTFLLFGSLIMPWTRHVRAGRDFVRRAFEAANLTGDLTYAAYSCNQLNTNLLAAGDPLPEVQREAEHGLMFAQKAQFGFIVDIISAQLGLIRTLRGLTPIFGRFDDEQFDELRIESHYSSNSDLALAECWYWCRKLQARFLAGDYMSALDASERAKRLLWTSASLFETAEYHFYGALSNAMACNGAVTEERGHRVRALVAHHRQLEIWSKHCPENFENLAALVAAEIARIEGRPLDAMELYERAIASARANRFVHNEALAYELAASFYAARGFEEIANLYLGNARRAYLQWGADGKVRQLDQHHPWLKQDERTRGLTGTIEAPVEYLDLATIVEVSQALSGEIVLEKLMEKLMRAALEHAGAERGLLIVPRDDKLQIEAEATANGVDVTVHLRDRPDPEAALPESLIRYGMRTQEVIIIDGTSSQNAFSADPYIVERRVRSILCLPLINQGKLIGILYLENNLAPNVFTPDRVSLLKVLASQAAISLEKSRLYQDLADRERKIRRLVDANIIGIFVADREGRILEANDAFLRILGYDREDLVLGRVRWTELSPPEWRERDILTRTALNSIGTLQPFEKEYFRKDGSRVPVLIGAARFKEDGDQAVAFVLDLTDRKRAEEALRESERRLRSAIDGIPGLVGVLAPNGEIESVNRQIIEYCGRPLEGLKDWGTNGTIHPDDLPHLAEVFTKSIAAGVPYETETRLRRFDGEYRWFDVRGVPIRDDSGRITRWYVLLTDIEDRTQALARLQQMQLDFARMNRVCMMGELAASLSHEITQPIASARNNARAAQNFLEMQPLDMGEVKEALACVVDDTDRAGDIIDRVREQMKKTPPRKEHFDLNAAIDEVIALARSATHRNGVSVQTRLAAGLPTVPGDRVQLQQVLLNLVLNAAEAMASVEAGARELVISTEQDPTGVLVAVRDSGPGIDPIHLERIFEAFYTTKPSGTGMGLSICRSIINAHGGKLWAEANEPRGALFRFTLPRAAAADVT